MVGQRGMSVGYVCMGGVLVRRMFLGPAAFSKFWPVAFFISIVVALWLVTVGRLYCQLIVYFSSESFMFNEY